MNWLDIAGHGAYALLVLGLYLVSKKNILGWPIRVIGDLCWLAIGILMGYTSIWMWSLLFVYLDTAGYFKWRQDERNQDS